MRPIGMTLSRTGLAVSPCPMGSSQYLEIISNTYLGGAGTDILTGIDLSDKTRGRNTVDKLTGGNHIDRFILVHDGRKRG